MSDLSCRGTRELSELETEDCARQGVDCPKENINENYDNERSSRSNASNRSSKSMNRTRANAVKKRKNSELERQRVANKKKQLSVLQQRLPGVDCKLSEIQTLRLTIEYIRFLERALSDDNTSDPALNTADFTPIVMRELQTVNSYTQRVKEELIAQGTVSKQCQSPSNGHLRLFPPNIHGPFPSANASHTSSLILLSSQHIAQTTASRMRCRNSLPILATICLIRL
ncbi:hypothetical protein AAVH_15208 [Aphelenchoides avenae]|nr:hypothetical protein AAVH_15208 [Aphelenchus avenae]